MAPGIVPGIQKMILGGLGIVLAIGLAGCSGKAQKVELMPEAKEQMTCDSALSLDTREIPDDDFYHILDTSQNGDWLDTCWKPLMIKALEENREIPMVHLARAVHRFNRRETKQAFHMAAFQYFSRIVKGDGEYGNVQKELLTQYLHLAIQEAPHKKDSNLKRAMLVCSRLDPDIYDRFFK